MKSRPVGPTRGAIWLVHAEELVPVHPGFHKEIFLGHYPILAWLNAVNPHKTQDYEDMMKPEGPTGTVEPTGAC